MDRKCNSGWETRAGQQWMGNLIGKSASRTDISSCHNLSPSLDLSYHACRVNTIPLPLFVAKSMISIAFWHWHNTDTSTGTGTCTSTSALAPALTLALAPYLQFPPVFPLAFHQHSTSISYQHSHQHLYRHWHRTYTSTCTSIYTVQLPSLFLRNLLKM